MEGQYLISMEASGKTAMWTRPDTGATPISYPVPPWSAAKGLFESVSRLKNTVIIPTAVEICAPVLYHEYTVNYGGPLRKPELIGKGNFFQHKATVLINVCYRFYAKIENFKYTPKTLAEAGHFAGFNSCHYGKERFYRRLLRGKYHDTPCLGWREFVPNYIGLFRSDTKVQTSINDTLPSFLYSVYEPNTGIRSQHYVKNESGRRIVKGRLEYAE